ncbi:MAG: hypothetical protein QME51_06490 [Planctomycetota bacterium]|nr:hypothetical protein [Planctomycetota bacterium]
MTCPKCGKEDIAIEHHKDDSYRYGYGVVCVDEHLHYTCWHCSYDWTGDCKEKE